jgi:hypothetical protein
MPGASSPRSVFTKRSDDQNAHELLEDSPAFKRARLWFWPIVISVTIFFGFFAGIQGAFIGFFYGLVGGGFLLHESMQVKKKGK